MAKDNTKLYAGEGNLFHAWRFFFTNQAKHPDLKRKVGRRVPVETWCSRLLTFKPWPLAWWTQPRRATAFVGYHQVQTV